MTTSFGLAYQPLMPPTTTATDTTDARTNPRRMRDLRTGVSSPPGDDGRSSIAAAAEAFQQRAAASRTAIRFARPAPSKAVNEVPSGWPVRVYVLLLGLSVSAAACVLVFSGRTIGSLWAVIPMVIVAVVAERGGVVLGRGIEVSISLLPVLFAAVVFGPTAAMAVGGLSMLGDLRPPYLRFLTYSCSRALGGAATGLAASWAADQTDAALGSMVLATLVGAAVAHVLDFVFCSITLWVRATERPMQMVRAVLPMLPYSVPLYTAVVAPLAYSYLYVTPWSVLFFLLPAIAAQRLFSMYQDQRRLARALASANDTLERANLSFASALVATLDARDRYTAGHSAAVAVYARDIAKQLGLPEDHLRLAHLAGLVHDIGKIGVAPGILEKPGPLTLHERRKMEQHCEIGERILDKVEAYAEIARIVRHHHERMDGMGYPDGLRGDAIPLISRIICVADAYNAMTSDRPYRDAMSVPVARDRLRQAAGTQFDDAVVDAFDAVLELASDEYRVAAWADYDAEASEHAALMPLTQATAA